MVARSSLLVVLLLLFSGAPPEDERIRMRNESFSVQPGGMLEVKAPGADVTIRTGNVKEARVEVFAGHRSSTEQARRHFDAFEWTIQERDNRILVEAERPGSRSWRSNGAYIDIEVTIPERFNTFVSTSGGDIEVSSLRGRTNLRTSGGDITVGNIQGAEITLRTSGGDIEGGDLEGTLTITTSGGDIELGALRGPSVDVGTSGGDIQLQAVDARKAEVTTSGGDIDILTLFGDARVRTSGGDIEVRRLEGDLNASTSGGDVEIGMTKPGALSLSTTGGNIVVTAPANLRADLDLRGRRVRVADDFAFRGDRSTRRVQGRLQGGGPLIKASTSSGSVVLRTR